MDNGGQTLPFAPRVPHRIFRKPVPAQILLQDTPQ